MNRRLLWPLIALIVAVLLLLVGKCDVRWATRHGVQSNVTSQHPAP